MSAGLGKLVQKEAAKKPKVCLLSSVPVTLWVFYQGLVQKLNAQGYDVQICSSSGKELGYFERRYGVKSNTVNIHRQISPFRDLIAVAKLVWIFSRNRYDIIHAHTPKAGLLAMIAASLALVNCRIYTCHGLPLETERGLKRALLLLAEKLTFFLASHVLAVGPSLLDKIRAYKICMNSKAFILGNGTACGIDLKRFTMTPALKKEGDEIRRKYGISEENLVIGFVGRLVPDKGIHILADVFKRLYESNKNLRLLILGEFEPHRGVLPEDTVRLLNAHPGIIYAGTTNAVEKYYAAMNLFVMPTRREGFGMTFLEAGAMNLPVIGTSVTGCVDAVEDGVTGLLVEADNSDQLYEAVSRLIEDAELRNRYGQKGRQRVEQLFDADLLIREHLKLYDSIASQ